VSAGAQLNPSVALLHLNHLPRCLRPPPHHAKQAHPADGKRYPHFLMFHPRDHTRHYVMPRGKFKAGDTMAYWTEVWGTGCAERPGDMQEPYRCPSGAETPNPGLLNGAARSSFVGLDQLNSNSSGPTRLRAFTGSKTMPSTAMDAEKEYKIQFGLAKAGVYPTLMTHTWCVCGGGGLLGRSGGAAGLFYKDFEALAEHAAADDADDADDGYQLNECQQRAQSHPPHHSPARRSLSTHHRKAAPAPEFGVLVRTNFKIGMGALPGYTPFIYDAWRNGMDGYKKCQRSALHFIEGGSAGLLVCSGR